MIKLYIFYLHFGCVYQWSILQPRCQILARSFFKFLHQLMCYICLRLFELQWVAGYFHSMAQAENGPDDPNSVSECQRIKLETQRTPLNMLVVWLPSIWHFPRNIWVSNHPLIDEVIFFRGVAQPPTSLNMC